MAPKKRKRASLLTTPKKRRRQLQPSAASTPASNLAGTSTQDPDEWPAIRILQESARKYLVDWQDHPTTGEHYAPSWVWKSWVTPALKADWEEQKEASKSAEAPSTNESRSNSRHTSSSPRRSAVTPSPTSDVEHGSPTNQTSQESHDSPILDTQTFIEDTGSSEGAASYQPPTQDISSATGSHSGLSEADKLRVATQGDFETNEDTQGGAQEATDSQEGHSACIDEVNATSYEDSGAHLNSGTARTASGSQFRGANQSLSISQGHSIESIEIPESPDQGAFGSLEQLVDEGKLYYKEVYPHLKSKAARLHCSADESAESRTQSVGEGIEKVDRPARPETAQEVSNNSAISLLSEQSITATTRSADPRSSCAINLLEQQTTSSIAEAQPSLDIVEDQEHRTHSAITETSHEKPLESDFCRYQDLGHIPQNITEGEDIERHDFAQGSQPAIATTQDTVSDKATTESLSNEHLPAYQEQEQDAQIVPTSPYLSTQSNSIGPVLPTTEVVDCADGEPATPKSRHDSSQEESQGSILQSLSDELSLPPKPPSTSLQEIDSLAPPRLHTPLTISPLVINMADSEREARRRDVRKRFEALFEDCHSSSAVPDESPALTGTRSPSIIPDKPPQSAEPPSLRNRALVNAAMNHAPDAPSSAPAQIVPTRLSPPAGDSHQGNEPTVDETGSQSDGERPSEFGEDIKLETNEFIVPIVMEHIQKDTYERKVRECMQSLTKCATNCSASEDRDAVEKLFQQLKAIETHLDLIWSESSRDEEYGTQSQNEWGYNVSGKLRFLGQFLDRLRSRDLHVLLVLKEEDDYLFILIEKFLKGRQIKYVNKVNQRESDPNDVEGLIRVTLLTSDSSHIIQPPDVIFSMDGATAADVRSKSWAKNPDHIDPLVPVLRLVVPRSLSHIELCLSSRLSEKDRLSRIAACLLQFRGYFGKPLSLETPRALEAADMVEQYIAELEGTEGRPEWPLPSIGSVKDVVEFETQDSTSSTSSSVQAVSAKRPLEEEPSEPSKRARLSSDADPETSHVSDSMPGTSAETSRLHETIVELQRALDLARANEKRALDVANASTRSVQQRDEVIHKRQTEYENVSNELRETKTTLESEQKRLEGVLRTKVLTEDRNRKHQADIVDLKGELAALRAANLASEDEKVAEITRLKKENEDLVKSRDAAVRDKETADKMQEYIKDQLRLAQNQAAEWKRKYDAQQEENERLQPLASGEATTLKNIHYGRSLEELKRQNELLKIEKGNQARLLQTKDEEIQRLKNGSRGYGTRQSSVPRSPRVGPGSRTGSPAPRDRLSNLRNG